MDACIERSHKWVRKQPGLMNPGLDGSLNQNQIERHVYATTLEELELDDSQKMGYVYKCIGSALVLLRLAMGAPRVSVAADLIVLPPRPHLKFSCERR